MELQAAEQLALKLMGEFKLLEQGWYFEFDNALRRFGACHWRDQHISLSRSLVSLNDQSEVEDTIRHEIAHALCDRKEWHGRAWEAMCKVTGAKPVRCFSEEVDTPKGDWQAICGGCGTIHNKFRRPTSGLQFCAVKSCTARHGRRNEIQALRWHHKNEIVAAPAAAAAPRAGIEHVKAQMRREQEMEEMKAKIADLESKLGSK